MCADNCPAPCVQKADAECSQDTKGDPDPQFRYVLVKIEEGETRQIMFADAGCIGIMSKFQRNLATLRTVLDQEGQLPMVGLPACMNRPRAS